MSKYKVLNWSEYNESLKNRGSISIWMSEDAIEKWKPKADPKSIGAPQQYSDEAILCIMTLKVVYNLPYRQLVGFLESIFKCMGVTLKVPHFTTIADRAKQLKKHFNKLFKSTPTHLVLDSSGFKIFGEGEWTVRQHGKQKRRRWKKFHIGICPESHEIIVAEVTELEKTDCEIGPKLMRQAPRSVNKVTTDGAYDTWECYREAYENGQTLIVPPRNGAVIHDGKEPWHEERNNAIYEIIGLGNSDEAIALWKKLVGYHERSLVETAFSRFKGIFGSQLFSKIIDNQDVELKVKAYALNKMSQQGMPMGVMS